MKNKNILAFILIILTLFAACGPKKENNSTAPGQEVTEVPAQNLLAEYDRANQLAEVAEKNPDAAAWLIIPSTKIDDPVVQGKDNEDYLRKDEYGEYAYSGCLYMDFRNNTQTLDKNTIIYGHNLGSPLGLLDYDDGEYFAQLFKFTDIDFAQNNPYIYYYNNGKLHVFEIFAVFYTEAYSKPVEYFHNTYSEDDFTTLMEDVKTRSEYNYPISINSDDKLITLSTCSYKFGPYNINPNQRFVVMGRLLQENAVLKDNVEISVNTNKKEPDFY